MSDSWTSVIKRTLGLVVLTLLALPGDRDLVLSATSSAGAERGIATLGEVWALDSVVAEVEGVSARAVHYATVLSRVWGVDNVLTAGGSLKRDHRPGVDAPRWRQLSHFAYITSRSEPTEPPISQYTSTVERPDGDVLFSFQQDVLALAAALPGWHHGGSLVDRGLPESWAAEERPANLMPGSFSLVVLLWSWQAEDEASGYDGSCGLPGPGPPCPPEKDTVRAFQSQLVCQREDPHCEAVAFAMVTLPALLHALPWEEALVGPAPMCPEAALAELGWRCDLTRIPEEPESMADAVSAPRSSP